MLSTHSRAFFTAEKRSRLSRGTSEIECGHISSLDKKVKVMKDLLKFQLPKTAHLNAAEYTNFIERFLSLTTAAGAGVVHYQQADVDRMTQLHGLLLDNVRRNMPAAETATLCYQAI